MAPKSHSYRSYLDGFIASLLVILTLAVFSFIALFAKEEGNLVTNPIMAFLADAFGYFFPLAPFSLGYLTFAAGLGLNILLYALAVAIPVRRTARHVRRYQPYAFSIGASYVVATILALTLIRHIYFSTQQIEKKGADGTAINTDTTEITLPGKIAVHYRRGGSVMVYDNSIDRRIKFDVGRFNDKYYSGHSWMSTTDHFIATEFFRTKEGPILKGNLVKTDIYGKFIEDVYKVGDGEVASSAYVTKNDSLMLFVVEKRGDGRLDPPKGSMQECSLLIMKFKERSIIKDFDVVGGSHVFFLNESPWLYNESSFIYNINKENGIADVTDDEARTKKQESGIYMYDIPSSQHRLLIPDATFGICSPVASKIAYKKGESIYCLDLKDNSTKRIYQARKREKLQDIHWTPDGKFIYLVFYNAHFLNWTFEAGEKLIEVSTGKEVPFHRIKHGFQSYSWR